MAVVFLVGGLIILCFKVTAIPEAFWMIIKYAFTPNAIIGGGIGVALKQAISKGAQRGLFSNEAGMGSTPHAHAQANVKTAHEQGTAAIVSVFLDTFVVLTMTALIVITTLYAQNGVMVQAVTNSELASGIDKHNMVQTAIASLFESGNVGNIIGASFVALCLTFFAFSTIISWNLFGRINFEYLFGKKSTVIYSILAIVFIFLGSIFSSDLVWEFSDFVNYLMVLPNAIALFALSNVVVKELKDNNKRKSADETPNQPLTQNIDKTL
jgi:AGCS family alanine or glycine:cation symporter